MAGIRKSTTKDGRTYYEINVSRGRGKSRLTKRWYPPDGWSQKAIDRELTKQAAAFELQVKSGNVVSRSEAAQAAEQAEATARARAAKLRTVKQYANGVFMPTKEATMSENGRASYRAFLDLHILPVLGDVLLVEVTPAMIQKLLIDFQKSGYAHSTVVKLYQILNGLFDMAFMDDSIPVSPMLKVKRPTPRKDESKPDEASKALSLEQLRNVLECVKQEPLKWQAYINLLADTGARRGEICGLHWTDINFETGVINIHRNLQYTVAAGVYECATKTGRVRNVDIGPETVELLKQLRQQQAGSCISKYVFSEDGKPDPMHPQTPTRYFKKFGDRYGIENFHPHLLRHTSASIAITNGADIVSVSQRLGHASTSTTLNLYAHANEESIRKAGQIVRDALNQAENKKAPSGL